MAIDTAAALRKLQSGQTLTPEERAALNLGPAVVPNTSMDASITVDPYVAGLLNIANTAPTPAGPMADNANFASDVAAQVAAATPADLATINAGMTPGQVAVEAAREAGVFYGSTNPGMNAANAAKYPAAVTPITNTPAAPSNPAFDAILAVLTSYGMTGVADQMASIRSLYPDISSADLMTLLKYDKRFNAPYMERFAGNAQLMAKGFAPLDEKTYLANEQAYAKVFNAYGLNQFTNQSAYARLIGGSVSPDEANTRVSMAFDRVLNDKVTLGAFNKFYPSITTSGIVATLLDPEQQLPTLQRQVTAAEIGGQALMQGLQTSLGEMTQTSTGFSNVQAGTIGAEELAKQGITKAQAARGYQAIAEVMPTAEKLSSIYGSTLDQYGQLQAEQEQFQGLASAMRKRQKISATEVGTWSGSSGTSKGSFSTSYLNRTSAAGQL